MATRIIDDSKLNDIAVAIQAKDSGGQMTVDDMPDRIDALPTGGTLIPKTITENGVYNATDDNADGYDVVTVDVSGSVPTGRIIYSDYDSNGLPHTMEYVPLSNSDTALPDRFISYGHPYTIVTWHSQIENIICPNHITELGIGGFGVGKKIKRLSNYDVLTKVGDYAFSGDIGRWNYDYLPPNLIYIGARAFSSGPLTNNDKFKIPESVEHIGTDAFIYLSDADRKQSYLFYLPSALKYLGNSAFFNNGFQCFPTEIIIPPLVENIGNTVFGGAAYRTSTITFRGTPNSISPNAFYTAGGNNTMKNLITINVPWSEGDVANAPWGAVNATINYNYTG